MQGLRRALIALGLAGFAVGVGGSAMVATSDHMSGRGALVAVGLVLGWSFIGTGLYAWYRRPENGTGALMTAVGFAWFLQAFGGTNAALPFTVTLVVLNTFYAALVHLLMAFPEGRLGSRRQRLLAAFGYFVAIGLQIPPMLFFETPNRFCENCPHNLIAFTFDEGALQALSIVQAVPAVAIFGAVGVIVVRRRKAARGAERAVVAPVVWAGVAMLVLAAVQLIAGVAEQDGVSQVFFFGALLAMAAVPYGFLVGLLRGRIARGGAVSELVERLGRAPAGDRELRDALADALGDPSLAVRYWLAEESRWIDPHGRAAPDPGAVDSRATTLVNYEGRPVAALIHDVRLQEQPELLETVSAAAGLALERQRLDAALRARVEELQASRARLVEASDIARRKLERDLHDGAQQRLVALALDLKLARSKLESDPSSTADLLDASIDELAHATKELRELARGIHPALLTDRGLGAAIDALAGRAPLPVEVDPVPEVRLPGPVESAAYFVVAEALTNVAKYAEATHAEVTVARDNGSLVVEVRDDGVGGADPASGTGLRGLSDRIAALDGRLHVESPPGGGTLVRAEVPCA